MKIGILTFQYANNYGALLQAYALRKYLLNLGHEVYILNYDNSMLYMKNRNLKKKILTCVWDIFSKILGKNKRLKKFEIFRKKNLEISMSVMKNIEEIRAYVANTKYDAYIVGSDQVWNPYITSNDSVYCLSFATNEKKIAYAASFGISCFPLNLEENFIKYINKFNFVSVRENTGKDILNKMNYQDVRVVLDPVFLLEKKQWEKLAITNINYSYILCYYMPGDKVCEKKIKKIAENLRNRFGYKIINIGRKEYHKFINDGKDIIDASPNEFLGYFKNAKFIVTNSFHGTAFSLIFEKEFYSVVNLSINNETKLSSRITDLLQNVELDNRIISDRTEQIDVFPIDYKKINKNINQLKKQSKDYLVQALN